MNEDRELDDGIDRALFERMRRAAQEMQNAGKDSIEGVDVIRRFYDKSVVAAQNAASDKKGD